MSSETPITPEPAAEPSPEVTAPEPANPEPAPKPEPDWRAAYAGMQRSMNKLHTRESDLLNQNSALVGTVDSLKQDMDVLLKQTVGDEEFEKRVANREVQQERMAALQAAQAGQQFITTATSLYIDALNEVGVPRQVQDVIFVTAGNNAHNAAEWAEQVGPAVKYAIQQANQQRIQQHEASLKAKTSKEVEAEANALTENALKAAGVDRIDTAKGTGASNYVDRVRALKYGTPEYDDWKRGVLSGRTQTK